MWWSVFIVSLVYGGAELQNSKTTRSFIKIYGGRETTIEKYPFAVQLMYRVNPLGKLEFLCGGSVITTLHVLTAAHCLVNEDSHKETFIKETCPSSVFARVGSTTLYTRGSVHQGAAIFIHPKYVHQFDDIAVLMLASAVTYSTKVQPAILPPHGQRAPDNAIVRVIGWGSTSPTITKSIVLLEATIRIITLKECKKRNDGKHFSLDSRVICAGLLDIGENNSCYGDSGGPLIFEEVVIGVTSMGGARGCADAIHPDIYTNISSYTNWIYDVVLATKTTNNSPHSSQLSILTIKVMLIYILSSVKSLF